MKLTFNVILIGLIMVFLTGCKKVNLEVFALDGSYLTFKVESPKSVSSDIKFFIAIEKIEVENIQMYYSEDHFDMSYTLKNLAHGEYQFKVGYKDTTKKSNILFTKQFTVDLIPVEATIEDLIIENNLNVSFNVAYNLNSNEADVIHIDIFDSDGSYILKRKAEIGNTISYQNRVYLPGVYTINVYLKDKILDTKQFTIDPGTLVASIDNLKVDGRTVSYNINVESYNRIKLGGYTLKIEEFKNGELYLYSYYNPEFTSFSSNLDRGNYTISINLYNGSFLIKTLASQDFTIR